MKYFSPKGIDGSFIVMIIIALLGAAVLVFKGWLIFHGVKL